LKKKVPFLVSWGDGRSLVAQVTDGLREAIVGGYYKPDDVVSTSRELAPMRRVEAGVQAIMSYCINRAVSISPFPRTAIPK
jgi:hypothetical protein